MNYVIMSGNPKKDGLCYDVTEQVKQGAIDGGADVEIITIDNIERCHVCGNGWGTCRDKNVCAFGEDGFNDIQKTIKQADMLCIITPVYWGELAEGLKAFTDRLRRCEFGEGILTGKQVLLIASPGGSGNGMLTCLEQMDRFCRHTNAVIFDYLGINRWNADYMKRAAYSAGKAMAEGRKAGESI